MQEAAASALCLVAASAIGLFWHYRRRSNPFSKFPYPPGPPPKPIIGNLLDMPASYWWLTFAKWSKQYGDVVHINVLGQHLVILDSVEAVKELLEKRATNFSDRPHLPMVMDLMGWSWSFTLMRYGDPWRRHRKIFHQCFHANAITQYQDMQTLEARRTLLRLIESPNNFLDIIRLFFAATVTRIVYGVEMRNSEDNYFKVAKFHVQEVADAAMPGRFLVDLLPILKYVPDWMPGAYFKRKARICRESMHEFVEDPYEAVRSEMRKGKAPSSIVSNRLQEIGNDLTPEEEKLTMNVAAVSYAAGADTTVSTLQAFFLAVSTFPEVQRKAQAEIDRVVGGSRLPQFEDLENLPYIQAVYKELLRWQPVLPLAAPHRATDGDVYRGYHIPKDTLVFGNSWSLLHDENVYADPMAFKPERFLKPDGRLDPDVQDPDIAAFGYGRRKCPGRYFATNGALIALASILSTFEILPGEPMDATKENDQNTIDFTRVMTSGALSYPLPFNCDIRPRSEHAVSLVKEALRGDTLLKTYTTTT